jgi:hypothetical protein
MSLRQSFPPAARERFDRRLFGIVEVKEANMIVSQPYDVMLDKEIAERAYYLWMRRGKPVGSPDVDWYRAVKEERREQGLRRMGVPDKV